MKSIRVEISGKVTLFNSTNVPIPVEVRRHQADSLWTYSALDLRQREIAARVREGGEGVLLLSEVAPVITRGRRTPDGDILDPSMDVHWSDRGGLATYHGPGQWILFPVDHIEKLTGDPRGVRKAVETLLQVALDVGRSYDSGAHIREGSEMGVWTDQGKFAAVGVHVENGVLLHGLAVNGFKTPTSFKGLRPCGLDAPVDFLLKEQSESEFQTLGELLILEAYQRFWFDCRTQRSYNPISDEGIHHNTSCSGVAQRESTTLTRWGSLVQSQSPEPFF